nr:glycosyltransferase family 39 protein [Maribacter sp.]
MLALVLIPVYIDFTFRRLSHTGLLCLCIVASYYCLQLLVQRKAVLNYLLLGLIVGVGLLSKYNYVFFLLSFTLVAIWDKELRSVVLNLKILLTISLAFLLVAPHAYWLLGPNEFKSFLESSVQEKIGVEEVATGFSVMPLLIYLKGILSLCFPVLVLFLAGYALKFIKFNKQKLHWFSKIFFTQLLVLGLFFFIFQSQKRETKWLLPMFLPFIILLLESIELKKGRKLVSVGFYLFYAVIFIQIIRTPVEKLMHISSSVHFGFDPIAYKLKENYNIYQWVLPNVTYAGNVRSLYPEKTIHSADDYSLPVSDVKLKKVISVSINTSKEKNRMVVDSIIGFGKEKENLYFFID